MYWYLDPTYVLVIIGALVCAFASLNVNSTYKKYERYGNARGITADQCAAEILRLAGINDVRIERIGGHLTDHYDPSKKVLRLSSSIYGSTSVAALGIAAHECGHAIQHNVAYAPLKLRTLSVPLANIGSKLAFPIIILGIIFGAMDIARIGVFFFVFVVLFQLITLPVEFNASARAITILDRCSFLSGGELTGAKKVLKAAALTYVAALFSSILQLLRLVILTGGRDE